MIQRTSASLSPPVPETGPGVRSPQDREGGNAPGISAFRLLDQACADSTTPSRVVRRDEAVPAIVSCLEKLSDAHRDVLELRFLQGLSVADVASRLG